MLASSHGLLISTSRVARIMGVSRCLTGEFIFLTPSSSSETQCLLLSGICLEVSCPCCPTDYFGDGPL
jgi:hypothetical protein